MYDLEQALDQPEKASDRAEFLAGLYVALNQMGVELAALGAADKAARLREWIKRLFKSVQEAAGLFGASGFSITIGLPADVNITVDRDVSA